MKLRKGDIVNINHGITVLGKGDKVCSFYILPEDANARMKEYHEIIKAESKIFTNFTNGGGYVTCGKSDIHYSCTWHEKDFGKIRIVRNSKTKEFFVIMDKALNFKTAENFIEEVNRKQEKRLDRWGVVNLELPHNKIFACTGPTEEDRLNFMDIAEDYIIGRLELE